MTQIEEKPVIFKSLEGKRLWGVLSLLSLPQREQKLPAVIIAHGFYGGKSIRKFVETGRRFAQNGVAVLRFDFSGCGDSEGDFKNMSIRREVEDLKNAFKFLAKQPKIDKKRIGFLGYSLGALIACLFQIENSVAKSLVLVAPALDQENLIRIWLTPSAVRKWRKKGYADMPKYRIGTQYLNEAKNYTSLASKIKAPVLIIHGSKDEDIPLRFSRRLLKLFAGKKKMIIVKGADHSFESYSALKELINYSLKWFKKSL